MAAMPAESRRVQLEQSAPQLLEQSAPRLDVRAVGHAAQEAFSRASAQSLRASLLSAVNDALDSGRLEADLERARARARQRGIPEDRVDVEAVAALLRVQANRVGAWHRAEADKARLELEATKTRARVLAEESSHGGDRAR